METTRASGKVKAQAWGARIWLAPEAQLTVVLTVTHTCLSMLPARCLCGHRSPHYSPTPPHFIPKATRLLMLQPPRMFSLSFSVQPKPHLQKLA